MNRFSKPNNSSTAKERATQNEEPDDLDAKMKVIARTRPPAMRMDEHADELVGWAIKSLEDAGIYPNLKWITRLVGGHIAQRELEPIVAQFYAQRRALQQEKHDAEGADRLNDLYQAVFGHAREKVRNQLAEEFRELEERAERLDSERKEIADERAEAVKERMLAEEIRRLVGAELEVLRADQKALTDKLEQSAAELTWAQAASANLGKSLAGSETAGKRLEAKLRRAYSAIQRLTNHVARLGAARRLDAIANRQLEGRIQVLAVDLQRERQQVTVLRERLSGAEVRYAESTNRARTAHRMAMLEAGRADRFRGLSIQHQHELKVTRTGMTDMRRELRVARRVAKEAVVARARAIEVMRRLRREA